MFKTAADFVKYWYFRYLLVTELYMVEKWERHLFHMIAFTLLFTLSLINNTVLVGLVSYFSQWMFQHSGGRLETIGSPLDVNSDL